MFNRYLTSVLAILALVFALPSQAQDSKTILDALSQKAKTFDAVYAEYSYSIKDVKNDDEMTQAGKVWIKDDQFKIDLPDYVLTSDGETIWTYEKANNVCTIDYLEDVQDGGMQPSDLFTIWETGFKHEWKGTETIDGTTVEVIHLYPLDPKDKPFHTIKLYVDTTANELKQVIAKGKDGLDTSYKLGKFEPNASISASNFSFDPAGHPGVDMQDNRL